MIVLLLGPPVSLILQLSPDLGPLRLRLLPGLGLLLGLPLSLLELMLHQGNLLLLLSEVRPQIGLTLSGLGKLLLDLGESVGQFVGTVSLAKKLVGQDAGVGVDRVVADRLARVLCRKTNRSSDESTIIAIEQPSCFAGTKKSLVETNFLRSWYLYQGDGIPPKV